jgi:hypothetical protein
MRATQREIREARERADRADLVLLRKRFTVDWTKARIDKRGGQVHAWTADRVYLGQFRYHHLAVARGAAVTQFMGVWFCWRADA